MYITFRHITVFSIIVAGAMLLPFFSHAETEFKKPPSFQEFQACLNNQGVSTSSPPTMQQIQACLPKPPSGFPTTTPRGADVPKLQECLRNAGVADGAAPTLEQLKQCTPKMPDRLASSTLSDDVLKGMQLPPGSRSCFAFVRSLMRGAQGEDVSALQNDLIELGYLKPGNATGFFGSFTEEAIKKFQEKNGVVASGSASSTGAGVFGPKTRAMFEKARGVCKGMQNGSTTPPFGMEQFKLPRFSTSTPAGEVLEQLKAHMKEIQKRIQELQKQNASSGSGDDSSSDSDDDDTSDDSI